MARRFAALALVMALAWGVLTPETAVSRVKTPVSVHEIGPFRVAVTTAAGMGEIPLYASADWNQAQPAVTRAVIVLHGLHRDAGTYFRSGLAAARDARSNALILAPQFLADDDIAANALPPAMLHWGWNDWSGGLAAHGPVPASAFDALDAVLARLADRSLFPALQHVVLVGHSAGGQVAQRYAVVGNGAAKLTAEGVSMEYVVANPSSYLYFSADRPVPEPATCRRVNRWKYGFSGRLPAYVTGTPASYEARFARRDVTYLLGGADTNPDLPVLDRSCAAEAQGDTHLSRGVAYFQYLKARHPTGLTQTLHIVPGVGHNGRRMLTSAAGLAAIFDIPN
jgi:pimeloyl-ACP methyl ester carboxylesterase